MVTYHLHCTRDAGHPRVVSDDRTHAYPVFGDTPLGKALAKTKPGEYVTVDCIDAFSGHKQGPFSGVAGTDMVISPILNVGKDFVFRTFFSTGHEMVGNKTGSTMQSFQTRLRRGTGSMSDCFEVVTLVTGCHQMKPVAVEVTHHFALKPATAMEDGPTMIQSKASADAERDLRMVLRNIFTKKSPGALAVTQVKADDFYPDSGSMQGIERGSAIVSAMFG